MYDFKQSKRSVFELFSVHLIKIFFFLIFSDTVDDLAAKEIGPERISLPQAHRIESHIQTTS